MDIKSSPVTISGLRQTVMVSGHIALQVHETEKGYLLKVISDNGEHLLYTSKLTNVRYFKDFETLKRLILNDLGINQLALFLLPKVA